ncbi:hypothetical protein PMAYCL1PPCAC_10212, partial [Pristionchus mayeri]
LSIASDFRLLDIIMFFLRLSEKYWLHELFRMFTKSLILVALVGCAAVVAQDSRTKPAAGAATKPKPAAPKPAPAPKIDDKTIDETVAIIAHSEFIPREARAVLYGLDSKEKRAAAEILVKYQNETLDKLDTDKMAAELKKKSPSMHRKMLTMSRMARSRYDNLQPATKEYLSKLGNKAVSRREAISRPEDKKKTFVVQRDSKVAHEIVEDFTNMKPAVKEDLKRHFAEPMAILESPYAPAAQYLLRRISQEF